MKGFNLPEDIGKYLDSARAEFLLAAARKGVVDSIGVIFVLHNGAAIPSNNVASDESQCDGYDEITLANALKGEAGSLKYAVVCREKFDNSDNPEAFQQKYEVFKNMLAQHPSAGDDVRIYSCTPDYPQTRQVDLELI